MTTTPPEPTQPAASEVGTQSAALQQGEGVLFACRSLLSRLIQTGLGDFHEEATAVLADIHNLIGPAPEQASGQA